MQLWGGLCSWSYSWTLKIVDTKFVIPLTHYNELFKHKLNVYILYPICEVVFADTRIPLEHMIDKKLVRWSTSPWYDLYRQLHHIAYWATFSYLHARIFQPCTNRPSTTSLFMIPGETLLALKEINNIERCACTFYRDTTQFNESTVSRSRKTMP